MLNAPALVPVGVSYCCDDACVNLRPITNVCWNVPADVPFTLRLALTCCKIAQRLECINNILIVDFRYNAFANPVAKSLGQLMPASMPKAEPAEEYDGSFLSFVVLDAASQVKPASVHTISDWLEAKLTDFCRLTAPQVTSPLLPSAIL